jgi:hypothetical protein
MYVSSSLDEFYETRETIGIVGSWKDINGKMGMETDGE